jgi:hypothetical protein
VSSQGDRPEHDRAAGRHVAEIQPLTSVRTRQEHIAYVAGKYTDSERDSPPPSERPVTSGLLALACFEEPDALIALVRVCGGAPRVTGGSTRKNTRKRKAMATSSFRVI